MMKGQGMMMKQQGKCWQVRIDEQWSVVVQHAAAEVFLSFSSLVWFSSELVQHLTGNAEPKPAIWHKGWTEPILNQFNAVQNHTRATLQYLVFYIQTTYHVMSMFITMSFETITIGKKSGSR